MTLNLFTTDQNRTANFSVPEGFSELSLSTKVSQTAYLTQDVLPGKGGRLHYLSTEWGARSADNSFIAEGTLVRPILRQGNTWLVAAVEQIQPDQAA